MCFSLERLLFVNRIPFLFFISAYYSRKIRFLRFLELEENWEYCVMLFQLLLHTLLNACVKNI